jgi:hypothetical protein
MEAIRSSETSVHTRSTRPHIPENGILHSRCRENLKSYIVLLHKGPLIDTFDDSKCYESRRPTLKMETISSSETSVHTRSTWGQIPEDGILHSHRREKLKSYTKNTFKFEILWFVEKCNRRIHFGRHRAARNVFLSYNVRSICSPSQWCIISDWLYFEIFLQNIDFFKWLRNCPMFVKR